MKSLVFKLTATLGMALFCMMPMANATGGGGSCGFTEDKTFCDPGSVNDERISCRVDWGGADDCTNVNCDGTEIPLNGPLNNAQCS